MEKFLLYGASGHAKVIADCIRAHDYQIVGVFDDNEEVKKLQDIDVIGEYDVEKHTDALIITIGDNATRKKIAQEVKSLFAKIIHPGSVISQTVTIQEGSVVLQGAIIQADTKVGKHCIINTSASVDHDCIINDFVHISPNTTLCGDVKIGEGSHIGAGATIIQGITVGKWVVVGAGAVIINDIPDNSVVVGNPGKIIKNSKK